jgi:hypothetical protein
VAVPPLTAPVPPATAAALRRAVLGLRGSERRRLFAPVLHVGDPGRVDAAYGVRGDEPLDHALRCDLLSALLRRVDDGGPVAPLVWLTRTGAHALHDQDAAWLAAARAAYAEAGRPLTLVVVTRQGWWDPRSGLEQVWRRLRER